MAPITFGDTTRGHRPLQWRGVGVAGFADYDAKLGAAHMIVSSARGAQKIIREGAEKLCAGAQVVLKADDGLLDEVAGLVEWPVPLLGTIDAQFMDVPPEVLIVSMRTHQRYFARRTRMARWPTASSSSPTPSRATAARPSSTATSASCARASATPSSSGTRTARRRWKAACRR